MPRDARWDFREGRLPLGTFPQEEKAPVGTGNVSTYVVDDKQRSLSHVSTYLSASAGSCLGLRSHFGVKVDGNAGGDLK